MYISLKNVAKRYGNKTVLHDISLDVETGQVLALLGPSGCGKTTLLNALAGLVDIDHGSITINDQLYSAPGYTLPAESRNIGMVFQDFALWPHMTVFDNIAFGLRVQKFSRHQLRDRVMAVLETVRMNGFENRYPHQLSGGQKQRIAIARALAPSPAVLLMDEPLSSLDAKLREEMRWQLMDIVRTSGVTSIYVTHDQVEALSMADQILLLNEGHVEQLGSPTELYNDPETEFCASFIGAANLFSCRVLKRTDTNVVVDFGGIPLTASVRGDNGADVVMLMIRPSELRSVMDGESHNEGESVIPCQVEQRAFHGTGWQYRMRVLGGTGMSIEWWNESCRNVGETVLLSMNPEATRFIRPTRSRQSV